MRKLLIKLCGPIFMSMVFAFFANAQSVPPNYVNKTTPPNPQSDYNAPFASQANRDATWNRDNQATVWEVSFNGTGNPANNNIRFHHWWDNPHDDDLDEDPNGRGSCKFRENYDDKSPSTGFFTVDRIQTLDFYDCKESEYAVNQNGRLFSGYISRRDEYLIEAHKTGLTIDTRLKLINRSIQSQRDTFQISFQDSKGAFAVYISPNCIKVGILNQARHKAAPDHDDDEDSNRERLCEEVSGFPLTAKSITAENCMMPGTQNAFHTYRIVMRPRNETTQNSTVDVFIDNNTIACISGVTHHTAAVGTYLPTEGHIAGTLPDPNDPSSRIDVAGNTDYKYPSVSFGDVRTDNYDTAFGTTLVNGLPVTNNDDYSTAFVIDYINYGRGAFEPYPTDVVQLPDGKIDGDANDANRKRVAPKLPINIDLSTSIAKAPAIGDGGFVDGIEFDPARLDLSQFTHPTFTDSYGRHFAGDSFARSVAATGYSLTQDGFLTMTGSEGQVSIENLKYSTDTGEVKQMIGNDDWTFEIRAQVKENEPHSTNGFVFRVFDRIGSIDLLISSDSVRLGMGQKFWGRSYPVLMDDPNFKATDFHTYRLVRKQNDRYVTLYIDDYEVPAFTNFPMSASVRRQHSCHRFRSRLRESFGSSLISWRVR